jgi:hypothetical protein
VPSGGAVAGLPAASELREAEWSGHAEVGMVELEAVLDQANLHYVEQHNKVLRASSTTKSCARAAP